MLQEEVLIEVENVSKRFCKDLKRSLRYGFIDSLKAISGVNMEVNELRKDEFWAVKDVSFKLRRGECLGLIGHNGAGKSTLLKMLNGLINPDKGKITMRGRIGALIELGAGFNPILTGRENIYNNGSVLGLKKKEIDAKIEGIIEFAEIRDFIDSPVQNYSSGMRVRLGFAVAAQMEPDILLIDEVLAVGDVGFRMKCYNVIADLLKKCCVIFVSHSMPQVARICNSAMLLKRGMIEEYQSKETMIAISKYYDGAAIQVNSNIFKSGVDIFNFKINDKNDDPIECHIGEDLVLSLQLKGEIKNRNINISFVINDQDLKPIALISSNYNNEKIHNLVTDELYITAQIKNIRFQTGNYTLSIEVTTINPLTNMTNEVLFKQENIKTLAIKSNTFGNIPFLLEATWTRI